MEYNSLKAVFGEDIHSIPISSNKSMIGHTLTAGGAVEAVFSFLTMSEGVIPPTICPFPSDELARLHPPMR